MNDPMMTLGEAQALLPGSTLVGDAATCIARVHSDTRSLRLGDLFVALKGERFDAHDFLQRLTVGAGHFDPDQRIGRPRGDRGPHRVGMVAHYPCGGNHGLDVLLRARGGHQVVGAQPELVKRFVDGPAFC